MTLTLTFLLMNWSYIAEYSMGTVDLKSLGSVLSFPVRFAPLIVTSATSSLRTLVRRSVSVRSGAADDFFSTKFHSPKAATSIRTQIKIVFTVEFNSNNPHYSFLDSAAGEKSKKPTFDLSLAASQKPQFSRN